jgi:hypothetical protein
MKKVISLFVILVLMLALSSNVALVSAQEEPTVEVTAEPTEEPRVEPTAEPTEEPTAEPTEEPTAEPTEEPTAEPTEEPTAEPTEEPTEEPTAEPTAEPTEEPTAEPTVEASIGSAGEIDTQALGTFSSILYIQNTANSPTTVIVDWKNETSGASVTPASNVTIPARGMVTINQNGVTGGTVNSGGGIPAGFSRGSAIVSATPNDVAAIVEIRNSGGATAAYEGVSAGMPKAFLPVMHANNWHQMIAVQNVGSSAAGYTIYFYNENGTERVGDRITVADNTLPVGASRYYNIDSEISGGWSGAAVVQATAGDSIVVGSNDYFLDLLGSGTPVMDISYIGIPETAAANTIYFPVTHNFYPGYFNGWMTFMGVQNAGSANANITVRYLNPNGSTAHTVTKTGIAPNVSAFFWAKDYTAQLGSSYVGSAVVTCQPSATCQIVGLMDDYIYYQQTSALGGIGYFAAFSSGTTDVYFPSIHKGTPDGTVVAQNLGGATANVTVYLYNYTGTLLRQFNDTIPAGASNWWSTRFNNPNNAAPTTNTFMNGLPSSYAASVRVVSTNGQPLAGTGNEFQFPGYLSFDYLTYYTGINK